MLYFLTAIPLPWGGIPQTPHLRRPPKTQAVLTVDFWTSGFT